MAYQETTTRNYGQRLTSSCSGILGGILFFIIGTALLWWNEGRAVKTDKMLNEAQSVTVEMDNLTTISPEMEGQFVHATAMTATHDSLSDPVLRQGAVAVKLKRSVEYYQYVEKTESQTRDKLGGGQETITTYTYEKKWTTMPVNSNDFHDAAYQGKNFSLRQMEQYEQSATNVSFGAYQLNRSQIAAIHNASPLNIHMEKKALQELNKETEKIYCAMTGTQPLTQTKAVSTAIPAAQPAEEAVSDSAATVKDSTAVEAPVEVAEDLPYVHIRNNMLYFGISPDAPQIGDVRVSLSVTLPCEVSILAKVSKNTFTTFKAKNGKSFSALTEGNVSAEQMYDSEHTANKMWLWVLRIAGIFMVIMGLRMMFGILEAIAKVVPFLGSIVGTGVGIVCGIVGFIWALLVIALAWLFYRPLISIGLLVIIGGLVYYFYRRKKQQKGSDTTATGDDATQSATVPTAANTTAQSPEIPDMEPDFSQIPPPPETPEPPSQEY